MYHCRSRSIGALSLLLTPILFTLGCQKPAAQWAYTGPRVYLITGADGEQSDMLGRLRDRLEDEEINAKVFTPDNWLSIVKDIDRTPDEEVILVGHGHGAFLCTQVVRHYAQFHKTRQIEAVLTIDPCNKDWPVQPDQLRGAGKRRALPTAMPIGHNALLARNFVQRHPEARVWGADLVSTRSSSETHKHPFYWYDHWWADKTIQGQRHAYDLTGLGVLHETIDNDGELVQRITKLCRMAALSPFHYTPPEHHPDVQKTATPPSPL